MTEDSQSHHDQSSRAKVIGQAAGRLVGHALIGGTVGFLFAAVPAVAATGAFSPYAWPVGIRFVVFGVATWGVIAGPRAALAKAARKQQAGQLTEIYNRVQEARGNSPTPSGMKPGEQWSQGPGGRA